MTTLREAYEKVGASYDEVLHRLMDKDSMVERFAGKFLDDPSYGQLTEALANSDAEVAFRAAHTMKGVVQNIGLSNLYEPVYAITECLRGGSLDGADELFVPVREQYELTVAALREALG
jgi:histidine phosphotransfer protein HptB